VPRRAIISRPPVSTFIDPSARFEGDSLGAGSRVLAYAYVGSGTAIGEDCVVHEHATLVGAVTLERGVTVGPGAVVGAEPVRNEPPEIVIRQFAAIGANAIVLPGAAVGRRAVIEPGAVVTESVPANAIVSGNPATIVAYVEAGLEPAAEEVVSAPLVGPGVTETRVRGVSLHRLTSARDLRGSLTAAEFSGLPFVPRRLFTVYDVPSESVRGAHAHRECAQFLVCLTGGVSCLIDDGSVREEVRLGSPSVGLHIPSMIWGTQWRYSRDAVLLVLASHPYDPEDYIRDYEDYLNELGRVAG
jgi:UDP-2-acetamido-3-amino-2,3-dideoxy-glucuronate N-acetyltransferase